MGVNQLLYRRNPLAYPAGTRPGFDPSHPAANGLVQLSALANAGNFYDVRYGRPGTVSNATAGIDQAIGPTLVATNSNFIVTFPLGGGTERNNVFAAIFRLPTVSTGAAINYLVGTYTAATPSIQLVLQGTSLNYSDSVGANVFFDCAAILGHPIFVATSVALTSLNWVVRDLATGQTFSGNVSCADSNTFDFHSTVNIGNRPDLIRTLTGAPMAAAMMVQSFQGQLSVPQLVQWAADAWAFWYPRQAESLIAAAASTTQYAAFSIPQLDGRTITQMVGY